MDDTYESLGPKMRNRLDDAELNLAKVRDYIAIMADSNSGYQHARVLCLLLGMTQPRPRSQ